MAGEDDDIEKLQYKQGLKASVHHTVVKICREKLEDDGDLSMNKQVMAAIAELTWKHFQEFAEDLEMFAKHAKRTNVNTDDVKLLVRKSPKLLEYINNVHENQTEGKQKQRKKTTAKKKSTAAALPDTDEDSRQ